MYVVHIFPFLHVVGSDMYVVHMSQVNKRAKQKSLVCTWCIYFPFYMLLAQICTWCICHK